MDGPLVSSLVLCYGQVCGGRSYADRDAAYRFPKAQERLEDLKRNGKAKSAPANGKLTRNQKRDEAECAVM